MDESKLAVNRRRFLAGLSAAGLGSTLLPGALVAVAQDADEITVEMLDAAQRVAGLRFSRDELQIVADLAIKHDLLVLSDEVYDQIIYDDNKHLSIAALPDMWERTFSCYAYTKAFAMDGWRLGYVVCHERFMPALMMITVNDVAHVNVFIQEGAYAALTGPQDCLAEMLAEDDRRRRLVSDRLNEIDGIICPLPQGTIYSFPDVSAYGKSSLQIAQEILTETNVVVEAGSFYGSAGEGHLRICFGAESYERIDEALSRLHEYFDSQKTKRIA